MQGLRDVIVGPLLDRADSSVDIAVARHDDDLGLAPALLDLQQQIDSAHSRQQHVRQQQVVRPLFQKSQRLPRAGGHVDPMPVGLEDVARQREKARVILADEDLASVLHSVARLPGSDGDAPEDALPLT